MDYTKSELIDFINENDIKFIRLAFCDIFGKQKNISVMPDEILRAQEGGISFDASIVKGFMNIEKSDLFLYPDLSTLTTLPWRPQQGRVVRLFCDIKHPDGTPFEGDGRNILKKAVKQISDLGYECKIGSECEFYLFEMDENGKNTMNPHDYAGYCDIAPLDKGENVRREICLALEEMGVKPERSHHEQGPGQNEIDFKYSDALAAADNLIAFKSVVKAISSRNGLFASFMPKPLKDHSGNGLHANISLFKNGMNIFEIGSDVTESFIAGIMDKIKEMTVFLNPLTNSYKRFGAFEAPQYITWSHQNRSQLIRIPSAKGEYRRMELRSPDPSCNPYIAFALLISAGAYGIKNALKLEDATDLNLYALSDDERKDIQKLPQTLGEAISVARKSSFIKDVLPEMTINKYLDIKQDEWERYQQSNDKDSLEHDLYFNYI